MVCALYALQELSSLLSFYLLLRVVFREVPRPGPARPVLVAAVSVGVSVAGCLLLPQTASSFELLAFFSTLIAVFAPPVLFRRPRFWRSLAVLCLYYATIDTLWSFIASFFTVGILHECVFDLILTAGVSLAALRANRRDMNAMAGALREIPWWLTFSLFLFELTSYYKEFGLSKTWYNALYVASSILIFLSILYLVFRVFRLVYTQNDILRRLNEQLLGAEAQKNADETLRRFRHDIRNHTVAVNALLEQGDYAGAKRYFADLTREVGGALPRYSTGNAVADSLLNVKAAAAAAQDAAISFSGAVPEKGIDPKDLCVCFGNLLDNAVEAVSALPAGAARTVSIQSVLRNNVWSLSFTNPAPAARALGRALPRTTKKDVKAHGIGLKNVRDTVKAYNGSLHLSVEDGQFIAEALFELAKTPGAAP